MQIARGATFALKAGVWFWRGLLLIITTPSILPDEWMLIGRQERTEELNQSHQIIIVAAELDDSTERIIRYLNDRDIPINVLFFQVFAHGGQQLLSRAWIIDPVETQVHAAATATPSKDNEPWNGEFYVNFGDSTTRSWEEALQYGFICAGGGKFYSGTLKLLREGDRIWVRVPGEGYVGVGKVNGPMQHAADFQVQTPQGLRPAMDVLTGGTYHREFLNDLERSEYFVPVEWIKTVPVSAAVNETGMFGNQNTVCRPKTRQWSYSIERKRCCDPTFHLAAGGGLMPTHERSI